MATTPNNGRESAAKLNELARLELERSIVLMVLANPNVEREIVNNYLIRNGLVLQSQVDADVELIGEHGPAALSKQSLVWRAEQKTKAEQLYRHAETIKVDNQAHALGEIAKGKRGKLSRKGKAVREQNVDRMLQTILDSKKAE